MDKEKFYDIAKKEGFIEIIKKLLEQKVEGDPWKERYIPILSILVALSTALAVPTTNYFIEKTKIESTNQEPYKRKLHKEVFGKYANICSQLTILDTDSTLFEKKQILKSFYELDILVPEIDFDPVRRDINRLIKTTKIHDNNGVNPEEICSHLKFIINKSIINKNA